MARYTGPRNKIARRLGQDLGLKTNPKLLERRLNTLPGQHGKRGKGKVSEFGTQLAEKQKAKAIYGVLERQFKNYYSLAARTPQATGEVLLSLLERRLDNVIFRLGFVPTRRAARQLISHGNVMVNNKKLDIPSYQVSENEVISLSPTAINIPYIKELLAQKDFTVPQWLTRKASVGKMVRLPKREETTEAIQEQLIVEFYSR
ncbi:MAG: 30S ribosomal protein S4 [bacterium]